MRVALKTAQVQIIGDGLRLIPKFLQIMNALIALVQCVQTLYYKSALWAVLRIASRAIHAPLLPLLPLQHQHQPPRQRNQRLDQDQVQDHPLHQDRRRRLRQRQLLRLNLLLGLVEVRLVLRFQDFMKK